MATKPVSRDLTFDSSARDLVEGFDWARTRALDWVQTGRDGVIPSYWAGLTDRPMFYSRDVAHQALGAHLLWLDLENLTMLRAFVDSATEARRHYPLWAFTFDGEPAAIDYRSDEDFVREVPAVFELVQAALEQALWTGDAAYLAEPFITYYRTAVTSFVDLHDPFGIGIAGESGSTDIFRGTPSYNETSRGGGLNLAADGVAAQVGALRAIARILEPSPFMRWAAEEAQRITALFEERWWNASGGHYVTGFLGEAAVDEFAFEPSWFPAVKRLASESRVTSHLDYVSRQLASTPPTNIEAFTYLPEAYFAGGQDDVALEWIRFLIASRADYPEVSYTVIAHLATGLTGLRPTAPGAVETESHFAEGWIAVDGIPLGDQYLDLRHEGRDASTLTVRGGAAPIRWTARTDGRTTEHLVAPGETVRVGR
jgi:hypothetical protein